MFIITRQPTIDWMEQLYMFFQSDPKRFDQNCVTLSNYIAMHKGQPLAFNDFMAAIGLHVMVEYIHSKQNPIDITNDNDNPNPTDQVGSDNGPSPES